MYLSIAIFVALLVVFAIMYNSLVSKKNDVENALGGISAYLKKRADLIPNLIATVQEYASHEKNLLTDLTKARTMAQNSSSKNESDLAKADTMMGQVLGRFMAVSENYPDLKASQNFISLQGSLNEIEEQLSAARRSYNASVTGYNNAVQMIPTNIVAGIMGYQTKIVFQATAEEARLPNVSDLFKQNKR